jgi:hypothetical protein
MSHSRKVGATGGTSIQAKRAALRVRDSPARLTEQLCRRLGM